MGEIKIKANSAQLELELGLSLAKIVATFVCASSHGQCTHSTQTKYKSRPYFPKSRLISDFMVAFPRLFFIKTQLPAHTLRFDQNFNLEIVSGLVPFNQDSIKV